MKQMIRFYKKVREKGCLCTFGTITDDNYHFANSNNYKRSGKKILKELNKDLLEGLVEDIFYLTGINVSSNDISQPNREELHQIKNSLEKYIQKKKLNIKLERL